MRTMVQYPAKDYDIDDGVYFLAEDLKGSRGGPLSSLDARNLVCQALQDERFSTPPDVRLNCVRVYYEEGYHVDVPVYRILDTDQGTTFQLASSNWKISDARAVTDWFVERNEALSPSNSNGGQFRRIVSLLKSFATSRGGWRKKILSGFAITALATECYVAIDLRDDLSLYLTMEQMRDRLHVNQSIRHPIVADDELAIEGDPKSRFFRDKLLTALQKLEPVFLDECTKTEAHERWDQVFLTDFFRGLLSLKERAPDETFIEELGFSNNPTYKVYINGRVAKRVNFRSGPLANFTSVGKGRTIIFEVETNAPEPYEIYWKVRNTGLEATNENCLRGKIERDDGTRKRSEPTKFEGCHYVEAYIVKDSQIVARTRKVVRIASHT